MRPSLESKQKTGLGYNSKIFNDVFNLNFFASNDPLAVISSGKIMARAWSKSLAQEAKLDNAHSFIYYLIDSYYKAQKIDFLVPKLPFDVNLAVLDASVLSVATTLGKAAAKMNLIESIYEIGNIYTAVLPQEKRSEQGIFYTPPALTRQLIDMATNAGIDWSSARILDPACGGGAFLAPVALKILSKLGNSQPKNTIEHIETHLKGYELDSFGAWMTQTFLEAALKNEITAAGRRLKPLILVCNSLDLEMLPESERFDLVIGNPPYGKVKLTPDLREKYKRSLFGHANLYGLFTELALNLAKENGIIGYLTPTSFLSGEYFKNLRSLIREESALKEINFVNFRKGVFEDVLQETMLATYQKCSAKIVRESVLVNQLETLPDHELNVTTIGSFNLPEGAEMPWVLPRKADCSRYVYAMQNMTSNLSKWGYSISTGPLVWNRHKKQLLVKKGKNTFPIIWAESISPEGRFFWKAEKKNHVPYFKCQDSDTHLIVSRPCLLLQRTTAKEQHKRLIAGLLDQQFIDDHDGVVVENHLNMIIPEDNPLISIEVLSAFLNSRAVNEAFRNISGSVAVSAYELESMPLPDVAALGRLNIVIMQGGSQDDIENACQDIYL